MNSPASVAHRLRKEMEKRGNYVVMANVSSGWFAVFASTWRTRLEAAARDGREGPNLVVYRTRSPDPQDHYVLPYSLVQPLLTESTLTRSTVNGSQRWNLTLRDDELHVTHRPGSVPVAAYHGLSLLDEEWEARPPEEVLANESFWEGATRRVLVNAYERDKKARRHCVEHYGRACAVCGMTFAKVYGPTVAQVVHVHHLRELSSIGQGYAVDPVRDLRPVCPNCHAVIHTREPAYTLEEVRALLSLPGAGTVTAQPGAAPDGREAGRG